jgi:transcriptional regulator with XRE-family HTH domain
MVVGTRTGASVRAARERLGWSRETLAHHSGVSWSAIAQIESGRRKDVRLSSLSALASALNVTVDFLVGAAPRPLLEHRVLTYGSDEELLEAATPFLAEGIERSDALLAVTAGPRIELLRDSLADDAQHVEFADSADWYRSPDAALDRYRTFVADRFEAGAAWVRIVGEPVWTGRSPAEVVTWTRYESILNLSMASSPATVVCPYDARAVPADVIANAGRTHPEVVHGTEVQPSSSYRDPEALLLGLPSLDP